MCRRTIQHLNTFAEPACLKLRWPLAGAIYLSVTTLVNISSFKRREIKRISGSNQKGCNCEAQIARASLFYSCLKRKAIASSHRSGTCPMSSSPEDASQRTVAFCSNRLIMRSTSRSQVIRQTLLDLSDSAWPLRNAPPPPKTRSNPTNMSTKTPFQLSQLRDFLSSIANITAPPFILAQ